MKTITELNKKWWYRLIKVAFISIEVLALVIMVGAMYAEYGPQYDDKKSFVYCDNGFSFLPQDVHVYLYGDYVSTYDAETFRDMCGATIIPNSDGTLKLKRPAITPSQKNYSYTAKYTPRDWVSTITYSLGGMLLIVLIYEIIRRVFYYVILGTLKPAKE